MCRSIRKSTAGRSMDDSRTNVRASHPLPMRKARHFPSFSSFSEYIPPTQVEVIARRKAVALDDSEGIYVRDVRTGRVRAVIGQAYMLTENEELWEKELPKQIENLLTSDALAERNSTSKGSAPKRDKCRVVTYRVPHNACVQIYDYKQKQGRILFGPELVMLGPDEQFTLLSLSASVPKLSLIHI